MDQLNYAIMEMIRTIQNIQLFAMFKADGQNVTLIGKLQQPQLKQQQ